MLKGQSAKISIVIAIHLAAGPLAFGQSETFSQPIIVPNSSSSFNQNGFTLPSQPFVSGQDVVKSTNGITCQSAVGSSGPKLDMGMIGSNDLYNRDSLSVYGRISVPLGKRPKRVDCTKLYDLEISRLKMELQLMRAGMHPDLLRMATNEKTAPIAENEAFDEEDFDYKDDRGPKLVIGKSSEGFGTKSKTDLNESSQTTPSEDKN